jgi:hypothetical protein
MVRLPANFRNCSRLEFIGSGTVAALAKNRRPIRRIPRFQRLKISKLHILDSTDDRAGRVPDPQPTQYLNQNGFRIL